MADRKPLDFEVAGTSVLKGFDAVRRKDKDEDERTVPKLNEVLAARDFRLLFRAQGKTHLPERKRQCGSILRRFLHKEIGVLCRVWEPENNGAGLTQKEIFNAVVGQCRVDFLG